MVNLGIYLLYAANGTIWTVFNDEHVSFFSPASNEAGSGELTLISLFLEGQEAFLNENLVYFYSLLPSYMGSREVPTLDCDEGLIIGVVNQIQEISTEQIEQIRTGPQARTFAAAAGHGLYRETQQLNGRTVYHRVPDAVTRSFLAN